MKIAAEIQRELQTTSSRLAKEAILREAWSSGHREFFAGAQLAYDPLVTFGVKAVPTSSSTKSNFDWPAFEKLATDLRNRTITGHAARDAIQQAADSCDALAWNQFYRLVLLKDLKCGTTDTTINKVLAEFGKPSEDYLIPVFACQLAKNAEDHPNHMLGPKLVDWKLDGCLSSEWTIEFEDGSKITIAEVVDNKICGKIKSYNTDTGKIEYNNILNWSKNGIDINYTEISWFRIVLENGKILPPLTGNHLVWLPKLRCWRKVELLKVGDHLLEK